jgi:soluble lytic murein transglycosylase-like protein
MSAAALIGSALLIGLVLLLGLLPKKLTAASSSGISGGEAKYPYSDLIKKWASKYGVDPDLVAAHCAAESAFNPNAENLEDPKKDWDSSYGIMQVQLAVAQDFGKVKDYRNATAAEIAWLKDISNNIMVGAWNVARWQKRYPFDVAVQMYNTGENGYNVLGYRNAAYLQNVREAYNGFKAS